MLRSVPLGPDDSNRFTVHLEHIRWDAAELAQHGSGALAALKAAASESLRSHFNCFAATMLEADTSVTEQDDGGAEATARVLCDSDVCAAAAEPYEANSDGEVEAARDWNLMSLIYQQTALKLHRDESGLP